MQRVTRLLITVVLFSAALVAQQKAQTTKAPAHSAAKPAVAAPAPATASETNSLPTEATVGGFLQRMFGYDQNLKFQVAEIKPSPAPGISEATVVVNTPQGQQVIRFFIAADQKHAIMGDMMPFGVDPFAEDRALLQKSAFGPTKGLKDAPVTLVEFGDLQCPACKQAQPNMERLMSEVTNVRLVFQNFPLEQLHPWALQAAKYLDCLSRANNDQAWTFITAVYSHQAEITEANVTEKLNNYVKMSGGDPAAVAACAAKPETAERIKNSEALGRQIGISGTPTLFVNGRRLSNLSSMPYDALKAIVEFEAQQKK